jgi:hypothetical protein
MQKVDFITITDLPQVWWPFHEKVVRFLQRVYSLQNDRFGARHAGPFDSLETLSAKLAASHEPRYANAIDTLPSTPKSIVNASAGAHGTGTTQVPVVT